MNIKDLQTQIAACRDCSLRKRCRHVSIPVGTEQADIMVVGQAPGIEEAQHGLTMIGQAGAFITRHIERLFKPGEIYYTNTVKCFPGREKGGDGLPPAYALEACRKWFDMEVALVNPKVIVAVGAFAAKYFGIKGGIRQNAGKVFQSEYNIPVIPVLHPAGLMRPKTSPEDVMSFVTSLTAIKTFLSGGKVEPAQGPVEDRLFGLDVETTALHPRDGSLWCIGVADTEGRGAMKYDGEMPDLVGTPVMHNAKFDRRWMETAGVQYETFEDTMLLAHILGKRPLNLKDLAAVHLGGSYEKFRDVVKKGVSFDDIPEKVLDYCSRDAWSARALFDIFHPEVVERGWEHVYEFDKRFTPVLSAMEDRGIPVAKDRMVLWREQLLREMDEYRAILTAHGLEEPSKTEAVAEKFWRGKARVVTTPTGLSTAAEDLDANCTPDQREWVDALLHWRQNGKFKSTYLDNWIEMGDGGIIHPSFNQCATATGRPSTSDPNLANVTKGTLFQMFVAPEGYQFIAADYSQIELRVLANVSNDRALVEAYLGGADMHVLTSNLPPVQKAAKRAYEFTKKDSPFPKFLRDFSKRVNFGIVYGITAHGLAKMLLCSEADAQAIIDAFYTQFPRVGEWQEEMIRYAEKNLYVPDWFGRPLWVPGMAADRGTLRHRGEKQVKNYPVQGGAAQITKEAMVEANEYLVNWVYDEVLYLVPEKHLTDYQVFLNETLVRKNHEVPYTIEMSVGKTWGDIKHAKPFNPDEYAA